mmetsp:Transcript_37894/g.46158  ORF Transcript_37894/g.46158 Transcript_37894/m.46158 type:complete len:84 (+) Transcript_37894:913-1164(+)
MNKSNQMHDYSSMSKPSEAGPAPVGMLAGVGMKVIHGGGKQYSQHGDMSEDIAVASKGIGPESSFYSDKNSTWVPNAAAQGVV